MATILVKNVNGDLLNELKRLKVELGCKTWADLLTTLVEQGGAYSLTEEQLQVMRSGVKGLLGLKPAVSKKWTGRPTVLEETRNSRTHAAR